MLTLGLDDRLRVQRTVVISLERRRDRLERFVRELPDPWPLPDPVVFDAVDGWTQLLPSVWRGSGAGAHGCWRSHMAVLQQAVDDGVDELCVFEDDALFHTNFAEALGRFMGRVPPDWRMLMLGGEHLRPPLEVDPAGRGVVRCQATERTHAYVVRAPAIEALLRVWRDATHHIDFMLPAFQERFATYAPWPFLVGQAAGVSDVTGHRELERWG